MRQQTIRINIISSRIHVEVTCGISDKNVEPLTKYLTEGGQYKFSPWHDRLSAADKATIREWFRDAVDEYFTQDES